MSATNETKQDSETASILRQPKAVWAVIFACVIAFMGIGLVDPILPAISRELNATPAQSMLLFTSYLLITGGVMFFTSFASSRIGTKTTLIIGLVLIIAFSALAGLSGSVDQIIGFRAGWGLGNALFLSTALAAVVGAAAGGADKAIILYEAALGLGIATGPLIGGLLGGISWRGPFFGTTALMAIGLIAIIVLLPNPKSEGSAIKDDAAPVHLSATFRALAHPGILVIAISSLLYNFAFFILLAYSPFPVEAAAERMGVENFGAMGLGYVFFGWGICLAITSVFGAPVLTRHFKRRATLIMVLVVMAALLVAMCFLVTSFVGLIICVVAAGLVLGLLNTVFTESAMEVSELPRPVASGAYSGVRFIGGAMAPIVAGTVSESIGAGAPYLFGAASVVLAILVIAFGWKALRRIDGHLEESPVDEAYALTGGDA
ncbi:MFS transporter [Brevibacterium casei]|uniref:Predicted arabinose efflux permease, MFS family n=2 Tax=Brevibacterium casei TaxID=33889 RepID=A0A2H1HPP8_9MICO|nr:MFS transporter [Brevibacterium casei]MBE4694352.1 MFS transporter [Brevibacterium casei]MBY3577474.1 MFS transporter [Brevibacterium casei]MCT2184200.1 MFS transporter [Brevibacterium casei]PAK96956.1 MFS transporter [Brevibacterium casei]QPR38526.1 MFS transporter [Brevibacterium casei]